MTSTYTPPSEFFGGEGNPTGFWDANDGLSSARGLQTAGTVGMIAGYLTSAIGAFYAADVAKQTGKAQADNLRFQQSMSYRNARSAEMAAHDEIQAGQQAAGIRGMQTAQEIGRQRVREGARGITGASANEVRASIKFAHESDVLSIRTSAVRRAHARRRQAVNARIQGAMLGVSARSVRRSAGAINPYLSAGSSLLGGAANMSQQYAYGLRRGR